MSVYIIVEGYNLDYEKIMAYVGAVRGLMADSGSLLQKFGGRVLVRSVKGSYEMLEGEDGPDLYQVLEFPTVDQAKGFWLGEEYQEVKKLRDGAGDFRIALIES